LPQDSLETVFHCFGLDREGFRLDLGLGLGDGVLVTDSLTMN